MSAPAESLALLDSLLPLVKKLLETHGKFYPLGAYMKNNGDIARFSLNDPREFPPPAELQAALTQSAIALAAQNQIRAAAIVYDAKVTLPNNPFPQDAIAATLEHRDNYHVTALIPYLVSPNQPPQYFSRLLTPNKRQIFPASTQPPYHL